MGGTALPEQIPVEEVLPKSSVQIAETPMERMLRLLLSDINRVTALIVITIGLVGCLVIIGVSESLRTGAFQLFSTIVSAALGFFFGSRERDASRP
jgi:hypothetical protein